MPSINDFSVKNKNIPSNYKTKSYDANYEKIDWKNTNKSEEPIEPGEVQQKQ